MSPAQAIQEALGGTQREVADRLGITFQSWNRYLKGHASPSAATVQAWCEVAGVTLVCDGDGWRVSARHASSGTAEAAELTEEQVREIRRRYRTTFEEMSDVD